MMWRSSWGTPKDLSSVSKNNQKPQLENIISKPKTDWQNRPLYRKKALDKIYLLFVYSFYLRSFYPGIYVAPHYDDFREEIKYHPEPSAAIIFSASLKIYWVMQVQMNGTDSFNVIFLKSLITRVDSLVHF